MNIYVFTGDRLKKTPAALLTGINNTCKFMCETHINLQPIARRRRYGDIISYLFCNFKGISVINSCLFKINRHGVCVVCAYSMLFLCVLVIIYINKINEKGRYKACRQHVLSLVGVINLFNWRLSLKLLTSHLFERCSNKETFFSSWS